MFINTILFIVQKDTYVEWCITTASSPLNNQLLSANQGEQQQFNFAIKDFYNCNRTWEDELKFTILCAALIIVLYVSHTLFFMSACLFFFNHSCVSHIGPFAYSRMQSSFKSTLEQLCSNTTSKACCLRFQ